jgi:hypothetical protein
MRGLVLEVGMEVEEDDGVDVVIVLGILVGFVEIKYSPSCITILVELLDSNAILCFHQKTHHD